MEIALLAVGLAAVVLICIRVAVAFVRWSRAHPEVAGEWALGVFIQESLGNWVDGVNDSPSPHHHGQPDYGHAIDSNHYGSDLHHHNHDGNSIGS